MKMPELIPWKPLLALATFAALIAAPEFVPVFQNWRVFEWSTVAAVADFTPRAVAADPLVDEQQRMRPETVALSLRPEVVQDTTFEMDRFYGALLRTERGEAGAVTRILHYGDSPTTADMITADVRSMLQKKFGDAGHGVYLLAKPWAWYEHRGMDVSAAGWQMDPATQAPRLKDGMYGLAGVSYRGRTGAGSRILLKVRGQRRVTLSYLAQPGGGKVFLSCGDKTLGTVDTQAAETATARAAFELPADAREVDVRVVEGAVRLFDLEFDNPGPGVIYSSVGLNGAYVNVLSRYFNEKHWAEQLRVARPDLVIINYGTNESIYPEFVDTSYPKELREVLRRVKAAVPQASVLLMSPMDRGRREQGGVIGTVPVLPRLVALQAKIASESQCAFFNTFLAMGGPGTMGKWYRAEPRLVSADFIHPQPAGAKIVGTLFYKALVDGYNRYKLKRMRTPIAQVKGAAR